METSRRETEARGIDAFLADQFTQLSVKEENSSIPTFPLNTMEMTVRNWLSFQLDRMEELERKLNRITAQKEEDYYNDYNEEENYYDDYNDEEDYYDEDENYEEEYYNEDYYNEEDNQEATYTKFQGRCFYCGKQGHKINRCWERDRNEEEPVQE